MTSSARDGSSGSELAGRRALVMGLGRFGGGEGAARYLVQQGARVRVTDRRAAGELREGLQRLRELGIETTLGEHRREDFESAELVVANPAVPPDNPYLELARAAGARVTSEIELFLEGVQARVVCVTGTQGKSSTCDLLHTLLETVGLRSHLGGNIGGSLLDHRAAIRPGDVVVLELSSYQLEALRAPVPQAEAVAVTNVLADHLERHKTLSAYAAAKARILELVRADGWAVLPAADRRFSAHDPEHGVHHWPEGLRGPGLHLAAGSFRLDDTVLGAVSDLHLPGRFQRANALVALGLAHLLGVPANDLQRALPSARGLEHRFQELGYADGRRVIDNAVSTTPDSTSAALRSLGPGRSTWIAGGRLKELPTAELAAVACDQVALAVCFGEAAEDLAALLRDAGVAVVACSSLEAAVNEAFLRTDVGETILFSPACSSFDAFANFAERAAAFRAALPPFERHASSAG